MVMKLHNFTHKFSTLEELPALPAPLPKAPSKDIHDLITEGLVWKGESQPVDNLWERCSRQQDSIPFGAPEIDEALSSGGLACGAVHEFYYKDPAGYATTSVVLPTLLARNAIRAHYTSSSSAWERKNAGVLPFFIAWIGRGCWPTPFALPHHLLSSCLFLAPPTKDLTLWAIETALRSPLIKLVIAECPKVPLITTRRFSLHAKAHGTTAFLLRSPKDINAPSSSATKWSLTPTQSLHDHPLWNLTLERSKGGALPYSSWTIGLESTYEERETISLRVLPRVVNSDHEEKFKVQRFG